MLDFINFPTKQLEFTMTDVFLHVNFKVAQGMQG